MKPISRGFTLESVPNETLLVKLVANTANINETPREGEDEATFVTRLIAEGQDQYLRHVTIRLRVHTDWRSVSALLQMSPGMAIEVEQPEQNQRRTSKEEGEQPHITIIKPEVFDVEAKRTQVIIPDLFQQRAKDDPLVFEFTPLEMLITAGLYAEWAFNALTQNMGVPPKHAAAVLPLSLRTDVLITTDCKTLRDTLPRWAKNQDIGEALGKPLATFFKEKLPALFGTPQKAAPKPPPFLPDLNPKKSS